MTESSVQRTGSTSSTSSTSPARRRFSDDFKRDAVRLVVQESYSFKAAAQAAREACPDDATAQQMREEIKHLRKQLNLIGSCSALLFATFDDAAQMDFTTN